MGKYKLNPDDSVLVIIDLQEKLMNVMKDKDKVYKNTNLLLSTAREFGIPVVLSEQYPRGLGPTVAEIKENLPPEYNYLEKKSFSLCGAGIYEILTKPSEIWWKQVMMFTWSEMRCVPALTKTITTVWL